MLPLNLAPVILGALVGLLLSLIAWGWLRARRCDGDDVSMGMDESVLLGLLLLAGFGLAAFLMYILT